MAHGVYLAHKIHGVHGIHRVDVVHLVYGVHGAPRELKVRALGVFVARVDLQHLFNLFSQALGVAVGGLVAHREASGEGSLLVQGPEHARVGSVGHHEGHLAGHHSRHLILDSGGLNRRRGADRLGLLEELSELDKAVGFAEGHAQVHLEVDYPDRHLVRAEGALRGAAVVELVPHLAIGIDLHLLGEVDEGGFGLLQREGPL